MLRAGYRKNALCTGFYHLPHILRLISVTFTREQEEIIGIFWGQITPFYVLILEKVFMSPYICGIYNLLPIIRGVAP